MSSRAEPRAVLVGACGPLMRAVISSFSEQAIRFRLLARADVLSVGGLADELRGASILVLRAPRNHTEERSQKQALLAARLAGIEHLVLVSTALGGGADGEIARRQTGAELGVRRSGIRWTILRAASLLQHLELQARDIIEQGVLRGAMGNAPAAFVDARDVAAALGAVVRDPERRRHVARTYTLTGPRALDHDQLAAVAATVLGRPVDHLAVGGEVLHERLRLGGANEAVASEIVEMHSALADGRGAFVTTAVSTLTGVEARSPLVGLGEMWKGASP